MADLNLTTIEDVLYVDTRIVADELDIEHQNLLQTVRKHQTVIEKEFGQINFQVDKPPQGSQGGRPETFAYLNEQQARYICAKSRRGLSREAVERFREIGFDLGVATGTPVKRVKRGEVEYKRKLAKELQGETEVDTLAGKIDVLTGTEVIEVKAIHNWKHALGQVLVYGFYYPSHKKRIHLYGETQYSFLQMVKTHCKKFGVCVTWEA